MSREPAELRITLDEIRALFGDTMPMEGAVILQNEALGVEGMRSRLRQLAKAETSPFLDQWKADAAELMTRVNGPAPCSSCGTKTEEWWNYCAMCGYHIVTGEK